MVNVAKIPLVCQHAGPDALKPRQMINEIYVFYLWLVITYIYKTQPIVSYVFNGESIFSFVFLPCNYYFR